MQRNKSKRERKQKETEEKEGWRKGGRRERGAGKDEESTLATTILPDAQTNKLLVNRK